MLFLVAHHHLQILSADGRLLLKKDFERVHRKLRIEDFFTLIKLGKDL